MHPNHGWQLGFLGRGGPCALQREENMGKDDRKYIEIVSAIFLIFDGGQLELEQNDFRPPISSKE